MPTLAQHYPSQPLRWLVGFAAGGGASIVTRIVAERLSERLGQTIIIENKPGASGSVSVEAVANSPPDGLTLLFLGVSSLINAAMFENPRVNPIKDLESVAGLVEFPLALLVNPEVPAQTVHEFIAYAKANPGKINMASFGTGSSSHLAGELFKMMTGIQMTHVPYRGEAPALADMMGGRIDVMFDVLSLALSHVEAGKLRILAMAGSRRYEKLPEVPTIGESVPGYEANSWAAVAVRAGTSIDKIEILNREINATMGEPAVKARLADAAAVPLIFTVSDAQRHVKSEKEKWAKVLKFAGVKPI